jgi:hypothetical protein
MTRFVSIKFVALSAVFVLGSVVTAPAATKPHGAAYAHTAAPHNSVSSDTPPSRRDSDNPVQTGGGSLGYNQMLRVY